MVLKKCLFLGICQLDAVVKILLKIPQFVGNYDVILSESVFNVDEMRMDEILGKVKECEVVVTQPVSKKYRGNAIFSTERIVEECEKWDVKLLVMANCYFSGYEQIPFQTHYEGKTIVLENLSYFPFMTLECLEKGDIKGACVKWCDLGLFTKESCVNTCMKSIMELKNRELDIFGSGRKIDITISDFIEKEFRRKRLFHTYNHPTNVVLFELTRRILDKLGLKQDFYVEINELLGENSLPPPPSVYYHMEFMFEYPKFVICDNKYSTYEAFELLSKGFQKFDIEIRRSNIENANNLYSYYLNQ